MPDPRFFDSVGPIPLKNLILLTGARLNSQAHAVLEIKGTAPLDLAGPDDLSFFDNRKYKDQFIASNAGACFARPEALEYAPASMAVLVTDNPYAAYAVAADALFPRPIVRNKISEHAIIDSSARIGAGCEIRAGAVIGPNVEIGSRCMIESNAVINRGVKLGNDCRIGALVTLDYCIIGNRVSIYTGARIGQDGFGYALSDKGHIKVPQLGRVIIEDDVEIGANTTIDRGAGSDTVIGRGCIIDNLVQIAHNVRLGPGCVLVSQSGVAGSTKLGTGVVMAAQSGIAGHLTIADGARLAAQSGIMRDVAPREELMGSPAVPIRQFFRQHVMVEQMAKGSRSKSEKG